MLQLNYERIFVLAVMQLSSLVIAERFVSLLGNAFLMFSPHGTGPAVNALFWLVTSGLVILAIVLPATWYFKQAAPGFMPGLIAGGVASLIISLLQVASVEMALLMVTIYTLLGGYSAVSLR